jgi:hypothetical protein
LTLRAPPTRLEAGDPRLATAHKLERELLENPNRVFDDDVRELFRLAPSSDLPAPTLPMARVAAERVDGEPAPSHGSDGG